MKKAIKKIVVLIVAMILICVAITSCKSYDKNYTIYDLWVAGIKVTTRNQKDILGDGTISYVGNDKSGIVTLNGANIEEFSYTDVEAFIVSTIDDLTINLVGENKIGMGDKAPVNGISAYDLTIKGEGSLAIGARASCIKADTLIVESGNIDTYIKTAEDEIASFIGVGFWAQELFTINGGDISVHYAPEFTALSYGLYCVKDLTINGGNIEIKQEEATALGIGIISSEKLTIAGGNISVYGNDDAINAKTFAMTGGTVNASAIDLFLQGFDPSTEQFIFGSDGVCRLVNKAEFSGGLFTLTAIKRMNPEVPTLYSKDITIDGMMVSGGESRESLAEKDIPTYTYTDTCIRLEKEVN